MPNLFTSIVSVELCPITFWSKVDHDVEKLSPNSQVHIVRHLEEIVLD